MSTSAKPKAARLDDPATEEMPGGRGVRVPLVGLVDGAQHLDVHINVLRGDSEAGPVHHHKSSDNVYIVLSGTVRVTVGDDEHRAGPGDVLFVPEGQWHSASAIGPEEARILEIYAPPIDRDGGRDFHR